MNFDLKILYLSLIYTKLVLFIYKKSISVDI